VVPNFGGEYREKKKRRRKFSESREKTCPTGASITEKKKELTGSLGKETRDVPSSQQQQKRWE